MDGQVGFDGDEQFVEALEDAAAEAIDRKIVSGERESVYFWRLRLRKPC